MIHKYIIFKNIIILRETFIALFQKKILILEKNKQLCDNKIILFIVNCLYNVGLIYILKYNNINIVYKIDNLIFYDENKKNKKLHVNGIITESTICKENNILIDIDFFSIIKKYPLNIPIYILIRLENISRFDVVKIKFINFGIIKTNIFIFNNIKNNRLYELLKKIE